MRRRSWRWLAGLAGATLACAGGLALLHRGTVTVRIAEARRGDLEARVLCDGNLEPPPGGELRAPEAGSLAEIAVRDGARVQPGQVLLRLASHELDAQLRQAREDLGRLEADLAGARAELDRARREADYRRQVAAADRRLQAEGAIARATLEADEVAASQAADRERQARAQVEALLGGGGGAEESRLALARQAVAELSRRQAGLTLRAPAGGVVSGVPHERGEVVPAGRLLASVSDPEHPRLRFRIDQPDLPRIRPGQHLTVTFSGQPERRWHGVVLSTGSGLKEVGGRQVGEAVGDLLEPADTLPANASVDVQVVVAARRGVLIVPRGAVHHGDGQRYVFVAAGGRAHRRPVSVGLTSLSEVEVTAGLAAGEKVILETTVQLDEGSRVAAGKA